jgi:hypothetical protein
MELRRLAEDRFKMLRHLARLLKWTGPHHPRRSEENANRATRRKIVRKQLKDNSLSIASRVMELSEEEKIQHE